jgi:hypothetical protein
MQQNTCRRWIGALGLGALLAGLALAPALAQTVSPEEQQRFIRAIEDASVAEPSEEADDLISLAPGTPGLEERDYFGLRQIKVAAFMSAATMDKYYAAPEGQLPSSKAILWVTAVPQLQGFCKGLGQTGDALRDRVGYWLGLPPATDYDRVLELWVPAANLFRPCADPSTEGHSCPAVATAPSGPVAGMDDYASFFANLYVGSYGVNGAPWTRLGYTYDWAPDAASVQGGSEFMVGPSTFYEVAGRYSLDAYCQP